MIKFSHANRGDFVLNDDGELSGGNSAAALREMDEEMNVIFDDAQRMHADPAGTFLLWLKVFPWIEVTQAEIAPDDPRMEY
ncbi:MAG: hypothetical protein LBP75_09710 [Planctomycetota bacterium]|jgi:hypothetical protein|nr:hypothetical protein [Planctomycetota bacterium]